MSPAPEAVRPSAWLAFRQSVVHFDAPKMNPWIGLRNSLGVALPLFTGVALHSLPAGVVAALGALAAVRFYFAAMHDAASQE